jgi:E3 ubiquitin-protein ligase MARCH6
MTQLRKITFSALVYGALVVVCLGGVVWGLAYAFDGVLPIHWSSNEPVLEFPVDLLFYNFLMPLAVRFFKPSDGLHAMYTWWFRSCARMLRLTEFLFDERRMDEEGRHVRRTWADVFVGAKGDPEKPIGRGYFLDPFKEDKDLRAYFLRDGRYVRTPASDQVRVPKGARVFLEVDEQNERVDGVWDRDDGIHGRGSPLFKKVYIPPFFRVRIFLFILSIWLFAACTGVCITLVPLTFGRRLLASMVPSHLRMNDVYAFSIGIYILGSALYALLHLKPAFLRFKAFLTNNTLDAQLALFRAVSMGKQTMKVLYIYTATLFVLPTLFALIVELYFIVPLHTYFAPHEPHIFHFVQSWTLGLLYVKLCSRLILWYVGSRPAEALRAIGRNGYFNPDVRLATRCFIFPATFLSLVLLSLPLLGAKLILALGKTSWSSDEQVIRTVYRLSYPALLYLLGMALATWGMARVMEGWRQRIRDEVYLIGERLHNFGDRKGGVGPVGVVGTTRIG